MRKMLYTARFVAGMLLVGAIRAKALDYAWTNSAGGEFGTAGNWDPAGPPGSGDTAIFSQGSGTRARITFPAGTTTTAGLKLHKSNSENQYEFAIANGGVAATYNAGATVFCDAQWLNRADLLVSTGTLVSSTVAMSGYDSMARLTLDGTGTTWRVTGNFDAYQTTLDLDVLNGATLDVQGGSGSSHDLWTEHLDAERSRVMRIRASGPGSSMNFSNLNTDFRAKGQTWLEVLDGASARFENLVVQQFDATYSNVYVVVSNATLDTKALTFSGSGTYGHLHILDGAVVRNAGDAQLDGWNVADMRAVVDNATWSFTGYLRCGWNGKTMLVVTNGGTVIGTNSFMYFPGMFDNPYTNVLVVTGTGSVMQTRTMFPGGDSGSDRRSHGQLFVRSGGVVDQIDGAVGRFTVWSNGLVRLDGGTVSNASAMRVRGTLEGSGFISGSVNTDVSYASVRPGGASRGILGVGGAFTQSGGALELEIAGATPGSDYDVLAVTGNVSFTAGTIDVSTDGGYKPPYGKTFYDLVTAGGTISTSGVTVNLPGATDTAWEAAVVATASGQALRVTATRAMRGMIVLIR